ncbi:Multicopper oxidase with three cupredoxin domains (includes cell division protein FtsP and spore coat protein CotA) [Pedococcus dokdonensis]|uniref:Copper-containing nitrite reductase n=1 Tax=Pedococcus dokdonensis TaxID=443156 RepID=A0A1H0T4J8_9MICO|nr:multicopper oxidase family protein [Pedococcus dokdonensis]SDP48963.1 Multicopper oxidase with three cupredoxin domains (includes cell division protein FtsP and spore coat protein CotA) [Pedococcus dokdonensis]
MLLPLAWLWSASLIPSSYSVLTMGPADTGGVPGSHPHLPGAAGGRDVTTLVEPSRAAPDVEVTLTARQQKVTVPGGPTLTAYTLNGTTPGPTIRAREGDLVQVTLVNESVPGGTTLHWHGIDVPNAEDGVAGVTQDAVPVGGRHVYRFRATQVGTYWYHSHQISHEQVVKGLLGAVVVTPRAGLGGDVDVVGLSHLYAGRRAVQGRGGDVPVEVVAGKWARVRIINTDNGIMPVWVSGASYQVVAVDGTDVNGPTAVEGKKVALAAGGRVDLRVQVPATGAVRVEMGGAALVLGPPGSSAPATRAPTDVVDLLSYGTPQPLGFDPTKPDRRFTYSIGRRPGFVNGKPGVHWTVNGKMFPGAPMFMVAEGDVAVVRIDNHSGETHPMHLHGHHVVVLARDGVKATGSPWWTDSLEVGNNQTMDVAFVADNPGIWLDHCHNLPHAKEGLQAHLMYEGVTTTFKLGRDTPNSPE